MEQADKALAKVKKWIKREISVYRIAEELGVEWITVKRWLKKENKPSYKISKTILETEIQK